MSVDKTFTITEKQLISFFVELLWWGALVIPPAIIIYWLAFGNISLTDEIVNTTIGFYHSFIFYAILLYMFVIRKFNKILNNMLNAMDNKINELSYSMTEKTKLLEDEIILLDNTINALSKNSVQEENTDSSTPSVANAVQQQTQQLDKLLVVVEKLKEDMTDLKEEIMEIKNHNVVKLPTAQKNTRL